MANKLAKKYSSNGVFVINDPASTEWALKQTEIDDVWGIGPRYGIKLIKDGVYTAFDFVNLPEDYVLKLMTIQGRRTYRELKGERCIPMEYVQPDKEGISTARSFNTTVMELEPLEEALANYVANAALKLRHQKSVCAKILVYAHTSKFAVVNNRFSADTLIRLTAPTNDTAVLIKEAIKGLKRIYVKGYQYQKVGVELRDLRPDTQVQSSMFDQHSSLITQRQQKILKAIDGLNAAYGKDKVRYATMGFEKKWSMRQEFLSRRFTTRIEDVIIVNAK